MKTRFQRVCELNALAELENSPKSEFLYVRGRRRVGKSWLLDDFAKKKPASRFIFTGKADSSAANTLSDFIQQWSRFFGTTDLLLYNLKTVHWSDVFRIVGEQVAKRKRHTVIIFDEVQWMASEGSGFVGALKEAWVPWQKAGWIKVIVCGSSNKFFKDKTGGQEKILRGLQTLDHLWVRPFSLAEVKKHSFEKWSLPEACLVYMMIGGIPYYLERLDPHKGFIHAVNDAFFTQSHNLLAEASELLSLDFNSAGQKTAEHILSVLGQDGCDQQGIIQKTGLPKATVAHALEKLLDYEIVFKKMPAHQKLKRNQAGVRYFMKDFFLNFYFQILAPLTQRIRMNQSGLIFPHEAPLSVRGYFIPDFSGKAFELLVRYILEDRRNMGSSFFKKLLLKDENYQVLDYWDASTQVDLLVEHPKDRLSRVIECKWGKCQTSWIDEVVAKQYAPPPLFSLKRFLVVSDTPTKAFVEQAEQKDVGIITLEDLYS